MREYDKIVAKERWVRIVLEEALFIDIFLTFLIINVASTLLREKAQNVLISSLLGGEMAVLFPRFFCSSLSRLVLIFCLSILIVLISYKAVSFKDFVGKWAVFLASTFVFGGGAFVLKEFAGEFPLLLVCLVGLIVFIVSIFVIRWIQRKNRIKDFCYSVTFKDNGIEIKEEGFLDSGNMLYDNITKKPMMLVSFDVFHKFYSNISFESILTKTVDKSSIKNGHYIKINSIGSGGNILVFTIDEVKVGQEKIFKDVMVGLSLSGFEKTFGRGVLLHSELV